VLDNSIPWFEFPLIAVAYSATAHDVVNKTLLQPMLLTSPNPTFGKDSLLPWKIVLD